jgi:hypothetical protein
VGSSPKADADKLKETGTTVSFTAKEYELIAQMLAEVTELAGARLQPA